MKNNNTLKNVKNIKRKPSVFSIICFVVLVLYCVILFFMVAWSIINSFKFTWDFDDNPMGLPPKWYWSNYSFVFEYFKIDVPGIYATFWNMFGNSIIYAVGCTTVTTVVCAAVAYTTAKFPWKFSSVIYAIVLFTMVFPVIGSAPSEMQLVTKLGLRNHWYGMFILKFNFLGMYFLIFYAMFNSIPKTYSEAAKIDGADNYTIMLKIYFPMILPTFFTIWLLNFVNYWNDYQTVLLYAPRMPTIAYGLYIFYNNGGYDTPYKLGACLIVMLPILVIFLIFRKRLMGKLSLDGGVKG